jgi:hypothetical protein
MEGYNVQISDLKADLNKRNQQVIGFVQKLKEIKASLLSSGGVDRVLALTLDLLQGGSTESLDWDYEGILEQSREFVQQLS